MWDIQVKSVELTSIEDGQHHCCVESHLGNVAFLHDTSRLISIGTDDRTIIQWHFLSESDSVALVDARRMNAAPIGYAAPTDDMLSSDLADGTFEDVQMLQTAQQVGAYLDSDSEDSDSDLSGAEIDSDIEKEKQMSYDRVLYREDYQVRRSFVFFVVLLTGAPLLEIEKNLERKIATG